MFSWESLFCFDLDRSFTSDRALADILLHILSYEQRPPFQSTWALTQSLSVLGSALRISVRASSENVCWDVSMPYLDCSGSSLVIWCMVEFANDDSGIIDCVTQHLQWYFGWNSVSSWLDEKSVCYCGSLGRVHMRVYRRLNLNILRLLKGVIFGS